MKYFNYFFFLLFILNISCVENKVSDEGIKTILLVESKDILPISSFIGELTYVELKASEVKVEIGEVLNVKELEGDLIVHQRRANEISFLRFSKDGKFLNEIVNNILGNGPISKPLDIILYKKDFAVLGENGIHIVSKDGKYKTKLISAPMTGSKFFESKNQFFVVSEIGGNDAYRVYSPKEKPKKIVLPEPRIRQLGYSNVVTWQGNLQLFSSYSDTVFSFKGKQPEPAYKIDGGDFPTFAELWKSVGDRDEKETLKYIYNTQHAKIKEYLENKNFIFVTYWLGSNATTAIINKSTWETLYYSRAVNDVDGGVWDKAFFLSENDELYIPINAYKIGGHKISNKKYKEFKHFQLHIAATENPVIMRCKLK